MKAHKDFGFLDVIYFICMKLFSIWKLILKDIDGIMLDFLQKSKWISAASSVLNYFCQNVIYLLLVVLLSIANGVLF